MRVHYNHEGMEEKKEEKKRRPEGKTAAQIIFISLLL